MANDSPEGQFSSLTSRMNERGNGDSVALPDPTAPFDASPDRGSLDNGPPDDAGELPLAPTNVIPLKIFISYRIDPDAPLASALRRLIEGSIDPAPEVFVSGDGGIRPSNLGFKLQLQNAARNAKAFVAVITNASKDREWIFFEAGAAWGQNLMYAPVLIGPRPEDLPSTIGDYQALRGHLKQEMLQLITNLAELNRCQVRSHFGRRFQTFVKSLEEYHKGISGSDGDATKEESDLHSAINMAIKGQLEEAKVIFDKLEQDNQSDKEALFFVKYHRERATSKTFSSLDFLNACSVEFHDTSSFQYWMASEVAHPVQKREYFRRAVEIGKGSYAKWAEIELAELQDQMGEHTDAINALLQVIRKDRFSTISQTAAISLLKMVKTLTLIEQLMIAFAGIRGLDSEGFRTVANIAEKNQCRVLDLYCRRRIKSLEETSESVNSLGRSRDALQLYSLALEAFTRTAELGSGVGVCNAATVFNRTAVAGAGRKLIADFKGDFDSVDPGFPYSVRADVERAVNEERKKEAELTELGRSQFRALWTLAGFVFSENDSTAGRLILRDIILTIKGPKIEVGSKEQWKVTALRPFPRGVYSLEKDPSSNVLVTHERIIVVICEERARAIWFDDFANGTGMEWFAWEASNLAAPPFPLPNTDIPRP